MPEEIQLETIALPGGREANMVSRMMQDSLGFIWLPSQQGLHRYDGAGFRLFPFSENGDPEYVESVLVDKNGYYWAASYRNGLFRFDPLSGDFEHFLFSGDVEGESPNRIYDFSEGPDGRIWLATRNGVLAFDPSTQTFEHYDTIIIDGESLPLGLVQTVVTDRNGNLWFGAGDSWKEGIEGVGGLLRYVESEDTFRLYLFDRTEKLGWNSRLFPISTL